MQQRRRIITEVKGSKYDTPSGTVGPMKEPVAEAGAEPDRGDWEKWYKHFIYIIPLIASMICSIGVINDQSFKQYAEKLSPTYVDFVRKNYAFAEEDLAEMERLDLLEKQLKEPVDATIQWTSTTGSKEELVVTDVAGDVTIPELLKLASQQHPHLPKDWLSSIHQTDISFKSSGDADVDISLSELSNRDQSNREQSSLSYKAGQTETDIETEGGALTRKVVMHRTLREALDALPNGSACSSSTDSWMLSAGSGWVSISRLYIISLFYIISKSYIHINNIVHLNPNPTHFLLTIPPLHSPSLFPYHHHHHHHYHHHYYHHHDYHHHHRLSTEAQTRVPYL
jgi:hypothetical protein